VSALKRPVLLLDMSTLERAVLHLDVSTPQRPDLCTLTCLQCRGLPFFWRCLYYRGLSCIWTCLRYRSLCCTWTCLHHKGPELHLDLSTLQRAVQLLKVSTLPGPELSLDYFEIFLSTICAKKRSTAATHAECALKSLRRLSLC
jgi:hypothetical protein